MILKHEIIKQRRKKFGYLPIQAAKYIGISLSRYDDIENGKNPNLGVTKITRLCSLLKLSKHEICIVKERSVKPQLLSTKVIPGTFGEYLALKRIESGYSIFNLSVDMGCSATTYSNYELSRSPIPLEKLQVYCNILGLDITEMLEIKRQKEEYVKENNIVLPTRGKGLKKAGNGFRRNLFGAVGSRLKSIRQMHHISRQSMITKLNNRYGTNLNLSTVERWEMDSAIISIDYAVLYCKLFGTSLDYIYGLKK